MNDESPKFVRYVPGPLTEEQMERMKAIADIPDSEIDFSDIPELTDEFLRTLRKA